VSVVIVGIVVGMLSIAAVIIATLINAEFISGEHGQPMGFNLISKVFWWWPANNFIFSMDTILMRMQIKKNRDLQQGKVYDGEPVNALGWDGCGHFLVTQSLCIIVFSLLLICTVQFRCSCSKKLANLTP